MAKGSIEKRGNNSWRLTVELGYDAQVQRDFERRAIRVSSSPTAVAKPSGGKTGKIQDGN